ncbi:Glycosyl transferase, group 2 family protein [Flavobacterium indicum GPTSA100-9 = DSM 17447]|uniref:Glycosyl transferase, group 2 family protein n=1 Tax=Flavobacterium indicum (strain DSM 17447 / CIP 109464 / GPTSA100-9) TaxID=1094466 RepID=H8XT78_FLAIG|nr:glycosyltransferase family 2 protein [Flavobacterium indicum]CCG52675.1 Glycosyl transferase, group 2 family protein [Flavobacterium indicum GPTSA100-9 = DSM 17447]
MQLSVVSTLYKSKPFLDTFIDEIQKAIHDIKIAEFELLFVNDGSPDDSLAYLIERKKEIPQIKILDLSRNFGHHYAMQAGLSHAKGDLIFLIDNDLETPPSILIDFYKIINEDNSIDVVYGFQEVRKGGFLEKQFGSIFWNVINKLSDTKIPHNILTERLMTKQYVDKLLELNDANLFLGGMFYWVGFNQKGVPVKKGVRKGASTYTLKRKLQLMLHAVTSFSGKPLEWLFYFGLTITFSSILFLIYLIIQKIIHQEEVQLGWTSIVAVNVLILGIISTFLGIIGIYLYKIFNQVQGRPNSIIKKIYE